MFAIVTNMCIRSKFTRLGLGTGKRLCKFGETESYHSRSSLVTFKILYNNTCHKSQVSQFIKTRNYTIDCPNYIIQRFYSNDSMNDIGEEEVIMPCSKIEKQLINFMDMWELKKAIKLLRLAVENDIIPNQTVVLNLLQQLANLGEVDFLLEMREFLLDEKLCSNTAFFTCLQLAYFNSGRVDEGVEFLRKFYHLSRKYQDVDTYFVLLTVMVLRHFPDKEHLIDGFIEDLAQREPPDNEPRAALWKCYMLSDNFNQADRLIAEHEELVKPFLSAMINDICVFRNKVDADRSKVLGKLLDFQDLRIKQQVLLYETYLMLLMENSQYQKSLEVLEKAHSENIILHADKVQSVFKVLEMALPSQDSDEESRRTRDSLKSIREWLDQLEQQ